MANRKVEVYQEPCLYQYKQGIELVEELNKYNSRGEATAHEMDHTAAIGIPATDCHILAGMIFFRQATAEMVADYLVWINEYYAESGESEKLDGFPNLSLNTLTDGRRSLVDTVETRLRALTRKKMLYSNKYRIPRGGGWNLLDVYTSNYFTFNYLTELYGRRSDTGLLSSRFHYNGPYVQKVQIPHALLPELHACAVAVRCFQNYHPAFDMRRERAVWYWNEHEGKGERYIPTMFVEGPAGEGWTWNILVDAIHFSYDARKENGRVYKNYITNKLEAMKRVICHYNYSHKKNSLQSKVRLLIVCENLAGVQETARLMKKDSSIFSEKVFFITDRAVKEYNGNLQKAAIMGVEREKANEKTLGLVDPDIRHNSWLLEKQE